MYFDPEHAVLDFVFSILTVFFSPDEAETKLPELHIGFNQHRYSVTHSRLIFSHSLK